MPYTNKYKLFLGGEYVFPELPIPEFPGEENVEDFEHEALKQYGEVDFYLSAGEDCGGQFIWDENRDYVGVLEEQNKVYIYSNYKFDDGEELEELSDSEHEEEDMDDVDKELEEIAKLEKQLAARKKAAKKAKKVQEKRKREEEEARKRAAFEEELSVHNEKISAADKALAEMTAKRDALVKEREAFLTAHSEFKVKKTIQRKSPGRQNAKWSQDSLTWIRSRIKEADGSVSQVKEYDAFMKAFPSSSRSKKAVIAKVSKEKQIWLNRESHEMAKSIGCFTQSWNHLYKKW